MNRELAAEILTEYYKQAVALAKHANRLVEESYLETCRSIGKTEQFMQFRYCYWQAKKAQYRRLHTKRDRYSAGSKRGRRR